MSDKQINAEMPPKPGDYDSTPSALKALLLVLCITFVAGCVWFYKAVA